MQDVLPLKLANFPLTQIEHCDSPANAENLPLMQSMQAKSDVAAGSVLYLPDSHSEQAEDSTPVAASLRYFPGEHSAQEAEAAEE